MMNDCVICDKSTNDCKIDLWSSYLRDRKPPMTSFMQHGRGTELFPANKTHLPSKTA